MTTSIKSIGSNNAICSAANGKNKRLELSSYGILLVINIISTYPGYSGQFALIWVDVKSGTEFDGEGDAYTYHYRRRRSDSAYGSERYSFQTGLSRRRRGR